MKTSILKALPLFFLLCMLPGIGKAQEMPPDNTGTSLSSWLMLCMGILAVYGIAKMASRKGAVK